MWRSRDESFPAAHGASESPDASCPGNGGITNPVSGIPCTHSHPTSSNDFRGTAGPSATTGAGTAITGAAAPEAATGGADMGGPPALSNPGGLPPVTSEGGYLTMTIIKQPGVTYEVQSAGSLQPGLPDSFSEASTTVLVNDATTLKVRDNFLIGTPPSRFLRVKITAAP